MMLFTYYKTNPIKAVTYTNIIIHFIYYDNYKCYYDK